MTMKTATGITIPDDDVWAKLAAPMPASAIEWRQDGKPLARDGRFIARFVAYIEATTVRERLDTVTPGEWNLTLELLPKMETPADAFETQPYAFKARLQILGVVREDVGTGKDYKQASTDAFKRVAVRFGIGHELYSFGQNWVQMDGDGKYAKAIEDPQAAYERRSAKRAAKPAAASSEGEQSRPPATAARAASADSSAGAADAASSAGEPPARPPLTSDVPECPECGGRMWDNRIGKRNPKAPDFKCRDRACDGVIWPPKPNTSGSPSAERVKPGRETPVDDAPVERDEIPF